MNFRKTKRGAGFTLIELLVVLAIVAVLAVVTIFTLNPAELLRQARDSNRISGFNTLKTAISLYLADVSSPNLTGGATSRCWGSGAGPTSTDACKLDATGKGGPFVSANVTSAANSTSGIKTVAGSGWLPVNFASISSGAPFGSLPADPTNNTVYYYVYLPTSTANGVTFKLAVKMESVKYSASGTSDVASIDGGTSSLWFETGTEMSM